jgi:uncharacterized RDD family membrane protein YckC
MSAPTPAPGDDRPREGYYPDPSIPGYVRYWNGASWVPGTSRPAPSDGEPLPPPPGSRPAPAATEETGPHFFDEDPSASTPSPAEAQHGSRPEPATAWGADRSQQSGFGGDQDRRVSWGAPDPRVPAEPTQPEGESGHTDGTVRFRAPKSGGTDENTGKSQPPASDGTVMFRRPTGPVQPSTEQKEGTSEGTPGVPGTRSPLASEGTMAFRALPRARQHREAQGTGSTAGGTVPAQSSAPPGSPTSPTSPAASTASAPPTPPTAANAPAPQQSASAPQQSAPMSSGVGGGQPSWAQQAHRLAGAESEPPVVPWKPVSEDPFQAAARAQAAARPAGLGKRLAARFVDTLVLGAVTGAAALPLGTKAVGHVNDKIDAAKQSGETVTVWLLDGTTAGYLGIVLGVLILFGVLYEALPTAKWGRTLGKKLCGLQVRDIEGGELPSFGAALRRWLVYSVPGVLAIGVLGVLWCLFDRPWHQCWHDKAAHTFVAG